MRLQIDPMSDATSQAEAISADTISAQALLAQTMEWIEKIDPAINALVIPLFEKAKQEVAAARGPFRGVPYAIKDLTVISKGDLFTSGNVALKTANYRPQQDSYFVERMRGAGFVLVGKASSPEMGTLASTESAAWGATRNPWDVTRAAGGSSGGSAAAVAAGLVPVAHGNDAGGSVRMPASLCGVVGLKPSRGRISAGPVVDSESAGGVSHEGLLARSIRDIAALLDIVEGHRPGDGYWAPPPARSYIKEIVVKRTGLRVGVLSTDPAGEFPMDPECAEAARKVGDQLERLGHHVSDGHPKGLASREYLSGFMKCVDVSMMRTMERYGAALGRELTDSDMEWGTWQMVQRGRSVTGKEYAAGVGALRVGAGTIESWWLEEGWDLLVTPTVARKAPKIGELQQVAKGGNPFLNASLPLVGMTVPFNVTGQPAISLPLHMSRDGLPIGVQLVAAYGREDILLSVSAELEQAMPWLDRRPSVVTQAFETS